MISSDNVLGDGALSLGNLDFNAALEASGRPAPDRSFLDAAIETTDINNEVSRQLEPVVNPMQRLTDVCLYNEDEEAAERVTGDVLVTETARGDVFGQNMLIGVELADMMTGGDVYETAERFIGALPREQQQAWRDKLNHCHTQSEGEALVGEMFRNGVVDTYRKQFIEQEKKSAEASLILNKMGGYVAGDAMAADGNELTAGGMSEAELAKLAGVVDGKKLKDARAVRDWMRTYVRPLDGEEDAEAVLRQVDSLEDELFELIGQDADRAGMAYEALMHWAEQLAESNKVDMADELVVAVGKKLSNWSQVEAPDLFSWQPVGMPDSTIANQMMLRSGEYDRQRVARAEREDTRKKHQNARAILRAAINRSTELGSKEGWWRGAGRSVSKMVGDTLPYLIPGGFGTMAGSADLAVSGMTERMDALQLSGMSGADATGQTVIETVAQGAAELLPWGRVGGSGLSAFLRKMSGRTGGLGSTGSISKWLINYTQKSVPRALVAEAGANLIDEGVLEPIASGIMQYGAERTFDMLGVPHGESRSWLENFDDLGQIWGDSRQLAALAIFSAGLSGAGTRGIMENVRWFADNRNMWLAQGFTEKQVEEIMASPDRWETGLAMKNAEWADAEKREAMKQRRLVNNKKLAERGEVLFMSGAGAVDSGLTNDNLAVAYAGVWNSYADKGYLPHVEAAENGMVHVFKKGKDGEMLVDLTLTPEDADAYLQGDFDLVEQKLLRMVQNEEGANAEPVNLKASLMEGVDQVAGGALLREAEKSGVVRVENLLKQLPPELSGRIGKLVKKAGGVTAPIAAQISEWAQGMIDGLVADGVSAEKARSSRNYAEGAVMSLGSWAAFADSFAERGDMVAPGSGAVRTTLFRSRGGKESVVDNRKVLGSTLFGVAGHATSGNTVEDVTESVFDEMVQVRAQGLAEESGMAYADAEAQAWNELADIVGRARKAVLKADPKLHIPVPSGSNPLSVIEAFSEIAGSEFILSAATPGWLHPLVEAAKGVLTTASAVGAMKRAWSSAIENDAAAAGELVKLMGKVGVRVGEALSGARIEQADVVAWRVAHGIVMSKANGPDGAGGLPVSKAVADAEEEEQAILHREAAAPEERMEELKQEQERAQEYAERVSQVGEPEASAPAHLKGIFVGDNCNYNPSGKYYFGLIEKGKLKHATEQVKVGTKGKHGVIAGRELTGNFQASAAPLYVWLRKDGSLWLISGRHRYELMMRDENMPAHTCYVFIEDAEHDEKWARMMDYENNMRDDQADEVTAGTYVRETGLSDVELEQRGLMRNASRSKRGALIGRHAREELWTRFSNGKIKPKDAEIVCELTRYIKDQSRVDEIQRRCCMLLDNGKSWDYIGGMVQLMVQAELEQGQQGWFNFGADFEAALERAATWIEKALRAVNENIELAKRGRDMSGKKADKAARLGIVTSAGEDVQQTLQDLQVLKGKLELIGSYPELRQQAEMWDGESEVDPVGWMLQQQALENERMAAEKELEAEEYLKAQQAEATGTLFSMSMGTTVDLQTVTNAWQNTLQRFVVMPPAAGTAPYRKDIVVCPTPAVMQMVGVTAWNIVISPSVLVKCLHKDTVLGNKKKLLEYYPKEKHEHDIELSEMMRLPAALADPVCIVVSDTPGCVEVVTELKEDNKNVLVAVQLNSSLPGRNNNVKVNRIASLYGKDKIEAILTHPRLYWNKAKARVWMKNGGLQLPTVVHQKQASGHKVLKPEDLVKYKSENNLSFSMGRNLAAVHSIPLDTMLQVEKTLGGLAKPSIAITRLDKPYSWGGTPDRVYLVGSPELADPQKGNLVYDRDAWTGKGPFLMESGGAYDYRKGEYFEPSLEEFVARTIKKKGMEEGSALRAQSAVPVSTMEAVKAHRDMLTDTDTSNLQKQETEAALDSLIEDVVNLSKKGLNYEAVAYILAKVCWRSSPMEDGAPSRRDVTRDQAKRILNEMGIRVKDIKKPLVDKFVKAVGGLKNELEDYLESVPQRAVMFNEFEYAVMPVSARGTAGLDEMLKRNGIKPIYHDGTEEGRKAALAGLVNDALVSFSMTRATQRSLELLESRSEEEVAQQIMDDLRKVCERLAVVLADDGADSQRGGGLRVYAEMQALLSAVRQALPEKYLKQGNLEMLLRWAAMYARMAQDGQVPAKGTIKGEAFEKFVSALTRQTQRDVLQGMSEEEVRDALMEMAGQKMEVYFQKVARDSVQRIDRFLKDRALERIEWVYKHAYPTREEGKAWSRGKMAKADYELANKAWQLVQSSLGQRKEAEKEMTVLRRAMRSVREEIKNGTVTEEDGRRRLVKLQEQLTQKELEAMQAAAAQQANLIETISKELEGLDTAAANFEDEEAKANEAMALQQTFGNWYYKDALEARRAARVFEDMVLRGKKAWAEKLQNEREHIAWQREQILAGFEVSREEATNTRMEKRNEYRTALNRQVVAMGKGLMNFGHLMIALRPLLGKSFCDKKREQISRMHSNTMAFNTELKHWMFETLRDITGLQTEEEQQLWLQKQNMKAKTGIRIREREVKKATLTYAEAKKWLSMTEDQAAQERVRILAEAAGQKRVPGNVPTSSMMEDLRKMVALYEADKHGVSEADKKFRLESEEWWEIELNTTKDAVLFGILTFEQPDYEHLMHVNGITPETLDQMRRYVGPQMLSWGYAMREKLSEHGMNVAQVFEAYTGIPFNARESYFKGVFDQGAMKEQTLDQAVASASGASGTGSKFGSLIPRRYHQSKINWDTSAAGVFVTTMQQQNNYVQTSDMIRSWRALLADKNFSARVEAEIGAGTMQQVRGWIELIEGAVAADVKMAELSRRMMRRLAGGYAKARLGGNIRTLIKQVSALLNGYAGGYVPDSWMLNNELCQEMTYRKIGFGEYMQALARVLRKRGSLKRVEVKDQAYIYARKAVEGDGLIHVAHLAANQNLPGQQSADTVLGMREVPGGIIDWLSRKAEKATERMMNWIAVVDAEMCTASALAVADVAYRNAVEQDKQGVIPDEVKRAEALRIAGMALDVAAQPQLRTQKGYWAASGAFGAMGDFLFMFRSDTLSKAGLWIAQMTSGEKMSAVGGWLAFGVMNSLVLAMLEGLRGNLGDDDDEWWQYALVFGADVLTNDVSALPVVGDVVRKGRSLVMGERYFSAGEIAQMLPFAEVFEYGKREFKYIKNGASWDKHWNATAGLLSALGSSCAVCQESTIGSLANVSSLTMAAGMLANTTRFVQGLIKLAEELTD